MATTPNGLTIDGLAQAVKAKYPDYVTRDNGEIVQALVQKHPEYQSTLHPDELAKITPGAMQGFKGGPIVNSKNFNQPTPQPAQAQSSGGILGAINAAIQNMATAHPIARDATLGAAGGAGIPETMNPVTDLAKGMASQRPNQLSPYGFLDPTGGALTQAYGIGKSELGSLKETASSDPGTVAHGAAAAITRPLTMLGGGEEAGDAVAHPGLQGAAQELTGIGPSKARLLQDLHDHAINTQAHIQSVSDAVHGEAQDAMSAVSQKIDAAHPDGVFPKSEVRSQVKDAFGDIVKIPEKMPPSVNKLLGGDKGPATASALTGKQSSAALIAGRMLKEGVKPADVQSAMGNLGFMPREVDSIMASTGSAGAVPSSWSFEQLKQFRTQLGSEIDWKNKNDASNAAAKAVYGTLSDQLRGAAKDAGVESDWLDANSKYKNWSADFQRSPVAKILKGQNATDIMEPLTGKNAIPTKQILGKYGDKGLDYQGITQEANRASLGKTAQRLAQPSKMDATIGIISPKAAMLRTAGPRMMRSPRVLDMIAGEGLKEVPASKIALKTAQKAGK